MICCFSVSFRWAKKLWASRTGISETSAMFFPSIVTASASRLSRRPRQSGQGTLDM